jgi:hypothetical protein
MLHVFTLLEVMQLMNKYVTHLYSDSTSIIQCEISNVHTDNTTCVLIIIYSKYYFVTFNDCLLLSMSFETYFFRNMFENEKIAEIM